MKRTVFLLFLALALLFPSSTPAADTMVFDSTDRYLGACQLTDSSEWNLDQSLEVTKFQVWYNWNQGETNLPVEINFNGQPFAQFTATRADCDPYQRQWCNADFMINKTFPAGRYSTKIPNKRQCLKPGGTGAIRLYIASAPTSPTLAPTLLPTTIPTTLPTSLPQVQNPVVNCPCTKTTVVVTTAALTSAATSILIFLLLKKFK